MNNHLAENRRKFSDYENLALADAEAGDDESLLEHATFGALSAWDRHPGLFASSVFENLLRDLGLRNQVNASPEKSQNRQNRILHVLTQAYPIGGHTRVTWRWMQFDRENEHTVLLTDQSVVPVPEQLSEHADKLIVLNSETRMDRLAAISGILANYDLIVLNIHPHDAVAVAACSAVPERPRTLLFNHADHIFWLGISAADGIINFRPSSVLLSEQRRSSRSQTSLLLPLPLDEPDLESSAGQALRVDLGIPANAPVTLLISDEYKLIDDTGCRFVNLLRRLLIEHPNLHHIGIGQGPQSAYWSNFAQEFPTRVHLLGRTPSYTPSLLAANIFLDSWPFSSITSALEAACWGLPILSYAPGKPNPLRFDDLSVEPHWVTSDDEWIATAIAWSSNPALAVSIGKMMRSDCIAVHSQDAWTKRLRNLVEAPWKRSSVIDIPDPVPDDEVDEVVERLGRIRREFS